MSTAEYADKYARRRQLKDKVEQYWLDEAKRPPGNLDSSLKKHTNLLNRLKSSLLVGPADALIKEIDGLTLSKYLEEIVGAVVEGASKGKGDPEAAVETIAHLHTRLTPDFLSLLLPALLHILAPSASPAIHVAKETDKDKEKDEKERMMRQRPVLRVVAELAVLNAWPEGVSKGATEVMKVIKGFMANDPQFNNLPLLSTFLKFFGRVYLGDMSRHTDAEGEKQVNGGGEGGLPAGVEELVPADIQEEYRKAFVQYFNGASKTLVKGQIKLLEQDKRNHEAYIKSGEIFEDRQHAYERMTRAVERLTAGVNQLAELLLLSAPVLPTAATLAKQGLQIVEGASSFTVKEEGSTGIWDDEEEQNFYEDLVDLKSFVPASLLGIKEKKDVPAEKDTAEGTGGAGAAGADGVAPEGGDSAMKAVLEQRKVEEDVRRQLAQMDLQGGQADASGEHAVEIARTISNTSSAVPPGDDTQTAALDTAEHSKPAAGGQAGEEESLQAGPAARLTALFAALPDANNREVVDKLAVEFAFLNSKAARKRLIRFISEVPKNRTDLLPHYARFVATLDPYMPDVGNGIIELLESEMRYLQRKKNVRELDQLRLKNCRFYGELAKFKVARPHAILHVLKVFLDDFRANIENISNLLETCGRFLLRYEPTAAVAKDMLELIKRKQKLLNLDSRQQIMLENAFYQCNPPERTAREVVELAPMHQFIQHLLHDVLMKRTLDKVTKLVRKLHWEDPEVYDYLLSSFTEIWEIKYSNIAYAAAILYDLHRYHPDFIYTVVDQVLEDIRIGMEENIFKHNQRRIASVKYLGEMYMYRVVSAQMVFDVLWSLITFGHPEGLPVPGRDSPIDSVDDFFRVRLVCTLLHTFGPCFSKGSQKRKMDHFLTIFQLYVLCKNETPMDVEFMLNDAFEAVRPKMVRFTTFAAAASAVDELIASQDQGGADDVASDDGSDDEGDRHGEAEEEDEPEVAPGPAGADGRIDDSDESDADSDNEADDVVVLRKQEEKHDEVDVEARADFDREFAKMLADTTDVRRNDPRKPAPIFDTAVPLLKKRAEPAGNAAAASSAKVAPAGRSAAGEGEGGMRFSLLSKKGGKQQVRDIEIPLESSIAVHSRTYQLQNKAEQEQLKRLVLENERRQGMSEMQAFDSDMRSRGIRVRHING